MSASQANPLDVFGAAFPDAGAAFRSLVAAIESESRLDERTRELILVGMLAALRSMSGLRFHAQKAIRVGATRDEVLSAVALAWPVAGLVVGADAMSTAIEAIGSESQGE